MSDWADGYVVDIPYTTGFYREITPTWLNFTALLNGYGAPPTKGFAYAELGCGLGHGTALMAATHPDGVFYGFDFNPQQIGIATRLTELAGLKNMRFLERSFEELARGDSRDLPRFDYIVLHGIWTWISEVNRQYIVEFVAKYLKPNGLVYVSYNCNTGWMALAPVQQFMREYATTVAGSSDQRFLSAYNFIKSLSEGEALYFKANPLVNIRLEKALSHNHRYLAHEYLNGSWYLPSHGEVRKDFALAKCDFMASATLTENIENVTLPVGVREHVQKIQHPALREMAKDLACNQVFRRDLFMRGYYRLTQMEAQRELSRVRLLPLKMPPGGEIKIQTPLGEVSGQADFYGPLLEALFARGSLSFAEALSLPTLKGRNFADMTQGFTLLVHTEAAHPAASVSADKSAEAFNRAIFAQMSAGHELSFFALPRHGTGIILSYLEATLAEVFKKHPKASREILIKEVWNCYLQSCRRPVKNGSPVLDEGEAFAVLQGELSPTYIEEKRAGFRAVGLIG
jgi:SAM-dependent methyltransferase